MKTLVTGGAGFIGSHLVERLLAEGHHVVVLDNLSTGREKNLSFARGSKKFSLVQTDIADYKKPISRYFSGVDWIFHLAALADIVPSIQKPDEYFRTNVDGTLRVLEASRKSEVKRFLYAASSSCYGIPTVFPTPETAIISPQYPYALTKYLGEQTVLHWAQVYKIPAVSLRLFNVFGPRSRTSGTYGAVFGTFLAQKLHNKPLTVVGDGTQSRDFTYVADVVQAFILAAKSGVSGQVFNVGSGRSYQVNELVKLIGGKVVYIPKRPGEPERTQADISQINKVLGWIPQVSFIDGVNMLLKSIDNWKDAPVWTPLSINKATKDWFFYLHKD